MDVGRGGIYGDAEEERVGGGGAVGVVGGGADGEGGGGDVDGFGGGGSGGGDFEGEDLFLKSVQTMFHPTSYVHLHPIR